MLGSGGPEIGDGRASSAYLVWHQGKARVLVDFGGGALLNFEKSNAKIEDLDAVAFSHFHIDHSADFPALIKASFFTSRQKDLMLLGPSGNHLLPSATQFAQQLFSSEEGVWPYMNSYLTGNDDFQIKTIDLDASGEKVTSAWKQSELNISGIGVHHGPLPAIAWRINLEGRSVTFSGDMSGQRGHLEKIATGTDILVAHNAIPEHARGIARNLHMPPSVIGKIAEKAQPAQLVLSHRMLRSLESHEQTLEEITKHYDGQIHFANDLDCFKVAD